MPASTFYTKQGEGVKKLLKRRYDVIGLVENKREPAFSVGSGFKELIIFVRKRNGHSPLIGSLNTAIYKYNGDMNEVNSVNLYELPKLADRNWLSLFDHDKANLLISIIENAMKNGLLRYMRKGEIIRGIEMYGPDFFFIPNKYWRIKGEDDLSMIIKNRNNGAELAIPKKYLVRCLRKPEHYKDGIYVPDPKYYVLAINEEPDGDLGGRYLEWGGEELGIPALKFGGDRWYQYIWKQLKTKRPYGYIFIHDKIDSRRNRVIANYSEKPPLCASKNFYIIKINNPPLVAAWYNSALFREIIAMFGRQISDSWTRFLEDDYLAIPVPSKAINVDLYNIGEVNRVVSGYLGLKD